MNIIAKTMLRQMKSGSRKLRPYYYVSMDRITHKCIGVPKSEKKAGALFRSGNWDLCKKSIKEVQESDSRYLFYQEHLVEGVALKETTAFRYHLQRQSLGRPRIGFETEDALIARLEGYVEIFREIERSRRVAPGYELMGRRRDEIGCVIGRSGEILKLSNGNNRFAIAAILRLPSVPIQIDFIHQDLLEKISVMPDLLPGKKIDRFLLDKVGMKA